VEKDAKGNNVDIDGSRKSLRKQINKKQIRMRKENDKYVIMYLNFLRS
jgi:ribosomal protein L6P/L9E